MVKTRIAPSPTGIPHIGNTRTALFNYLWAKKNGGKFILRIEDTDQKRIIPGAREAIDEILQWLGLLPDETYVQSDRIEIYKKYSKELLDKNLAYKEDGAIRFRMPKDGETSWHDAIAHKSIFFQNKTQEDFVLLKSDGFPTYHLANVVDDHLMEITTVIRGDEWISSTPKHIKLYEAFNWDPPIFAHLPVILGSDGGKLSKRHGAASVLDYREMGYLEEALINYMASLGWRPSGAGLKDIELFTVKELEDIFLLDDVNTAAPVFDLKKLEWMNGTYIRNLSLQDLKKKVTEFYQNDSEVQKILKNENTDMLLKLSQSRMKTLANFSTLVLPSQNPVQFSAEEKEIAKKLVAALEKFNEWKTEPLLSFLKAFQKENAVSMKKIYKIIMNRDQGIPMIEWMEMQGREKVISQIRKTAS